MSDQIIRINTDSAFPTLQEYEVYKLVDENNPVLHTKAKPYDFGAYVREGKQYNSPENPYYLASSLFETLFKHDGLGLAAPQCGIPYAVLVIGTRESKQVMFNPVITRVVDETVEKDVEGCLSYPGLIIKVPRSKAIEVKWQGLDGKEQSGIFTGLTARVIQHEIAHLLGLDFWYPAGDMTLHLAKKKREKLLKKVLRAKSRN